MLTGLHQTSDHDIMDSSSSMFSLLTAHSEGRTRLLEFGESYVIRLAF